MKQNKRFRRIPINAEVVLIMSSVTDMKYTVRSLNNNHCLRVTNAKGHFVHLQYYFELPRLLRRIRYLDSKFELAAKRRVRVEQLSLPFSSAGISEEANRMVDIRKQLEEIIRVAQSALKLCLENSYTLRSFL